MQRNWILVFSIVFMTVLVGFHTAAADEVDLKRGFGAVVAPFLDQHCLDCHGSEDPEAMLDLTRFGSMDDVVNGFATWQHVAQRVHAGEMPPEDADQPSDEARQAVVRWSRSLREFEASRNAGDPGAVLSHRLSAAEYDYTIRDLTGVDIGPARQFPVDPANEAGFDNTGQSLSMTPGLLTKYLAAARMVSDHLVLKPDGIAFADHPVIVDTDRDKYCVRRIIDFYEQQNTNLADYFFAVWKVHQLGPYSNLGAALDLIADRQQVSRKYLETLWRLLEGTKNHFGPIAELRSMWQKIGYGETKENVARQQAEEMANYVIDLRPKLTHAFPNLQVKGINNGTQPFVLWRNRQYATHRMTLNHDSLRRPSDKSDEELQAEREKLEAEAKIAQAKKEELTAKSKQELAELAKKLDAKVAAKELTEYEAYVQRLIANRKWEERLKKIVVTVPDTDSRLLLPEDTEMQKNHIQAFEVFCSVFPDAFFIKSRGREYTGLQGEQLADEGRVRLLSAGFHSQMGYFRDDTPLYELMLTEAEQQELDVLWLELDFIANIPQRQHQGYIWYERGESRFINGEEFDFARAEDKDITSPENIRRFADTYIAKAESAGASDTALDALREHFFAIDSNIRQVETARQRSEQLHIEALVDFAQRAYRRPLLNADEEEIQDFYDVLRSRDGLSHEIALRDVLVRILTSPNFCFSTQPSDATDPIHPLSPHALASRLSYFLWASMPDDELLASADRNELHDPEILKAHVRRMISDDRIRGFAERFGGNWLGYASFPQHKGVDRGRFPAFDDELRSSMYQEPIEFMVDLLRRDGSLLDLLYADHTFVNPALAKHYGIDDASIESGQWKRVDNASQHGRGGLLPMSVFLTKNAHALRTSPVKRGYWVVRHLLGERIPPPPPEVPELPEDESELGELTLSQVLAKHREHESCSGCHDRFDAQGIALEGYGPIGQRRSIDLGGRPVQTSTLFPDGAERDGLAGLREYIREHRESDFIDNTCQKLLSYALGRTLIVADDVLLDAMHGQLADDDHRLVGLIETIVTSPPFLNQRGRNYRQPE